MAGPKPQVAIRPLRARTTPQSQFFDSYIFECIGVPRKPGCRVRGEIRRDVPPRRHRFRSLLPVRFGRDWEAEAKRYTGRGIR